MNEMLKKLGIFLLDVLKQLDWKSVLYKAYKDIVEAKLQELVESSESKIDDVIKAGVDQLVEKFLAPEKVEEVVEEVKEITE